MTAAPEGMPDAVRDVHARFFEGTHYIGALLFSDPRMRQVWQTLIAEGRKRETKDPKDLKARLSSLHPSYRMETWDASTAGVSDSERASASFFLAAAIIFARENATIKEQDIKQEAERWRAGAALCREAIYSPHRARVDPALADALRTLAAYFEEWAKFIQTASAGSPYLIGREAKYGAPGGKGGSPATKTFEDRSVSLPRLRGIYLEPSYMFPSRPPRALPQA